MSSGNNDCLIGISLLRPNNGLSNVMILVYDIQCVPEPDGHKG